MALSNTIFSPTHSRPISRQARLPAQIPPPDLSLALFGDRRKFVEGVMPLLTMRLAAAFFLRCRFTVIVARYDNSDLANLLGSL